MGEHDLISRKALLEKECCGRISGNDVRDAPAIDAVPVVRCKNCRNWDRTRRTPSGSHFCFCTMMHTAENHYCGHGRKMDGENECSDG